jgi:hypothetical protein
MSKKLKTDSEWVTWILNHCKKELNGCFIYSKSIRHNGKNVTTSRLMYEGMVGPIPKGMVAGKTCGNPQCCNPDHLVIRERGAESNLISNNRKFNIDIVDEIKKLRFQQKTIGEISFALGISKASVSKYMRGISLSDKTLASLHKQSRIKANNTVRLKRNLLWDNQFKFKGVVTQNSYSREIKGSIAEAAIIYRLLIHNYHVYSSIFSGNRIDIIAYSIKMDKFIKIQVKCLSKYNGNITPQVRNRRTKGHNEQVTYSKKDLDILVGYDVLNETAYVFTYNELKNRQVLNVTVESKENWDKLKTFIGT